MERYISMKFKHFDIPKDDPTPEQRSEFSKLQRSRAKLLIDYYDRPTVSVQWKDFKVVKPSAACNVSYATITPIRWYHRLWTKVKSVFIKPKPIQINPRLTDVSGSFLLQKKDFYEARKRSEADLKPGD